MQYAGLKHKEIDQEKKSDIKHINNAVTLMMKVKLQINKALQKFRIYAPGSNVSIMNFKLLK